MKLKYKHQQFQDDAVRAVADCFAGQPHHDVTESLFPPADGYEAGSGGELFDIAALGNAPLLPQLPMRDNIRRVQLRQGLRPIEQIEGDGRTLTIEMETGTGKTFTYIKTLFELNKLYGWSKFIIVVPSIAIREGVLSSLGSMSDYFAAEYGKRIAYFAYNSKQLARIDGFAASAGMQAMIINTQAFNASFNEQKNVDGRRGNAAARVIFTHRDEFRSRRPIDIIAATRPIMIIDEPQSVLGANTDNRTRKGIEQFHPLFKLLYSATHRKNDIANMVFRLDAIDALNKHLVKKIEVVGVAQKGTTATHGYVYLERIIVGKGNPQARINFDTSRRAGTLAQTSRTVGEGFDLLAASGGLEEYRDGFVVEQIDGLERSIRLSNGTELHEGQMIGNTGEELVRRNQIRETIRKHLEREAELYKRHIKVLSLFFIDHVSSYRLYDKEEMKGKYAKMFEEEYDKVKAELLPSIADKDYRDYLLDSRNAADCAHRGYFARDRKGHMVDPKTERGSSDSNDESAYDLIMKDKERLLSLQEPVRFIFSHSALKEGWDNPNVFQICTLKQSDNETKKRQEVGRGLRLCVDQEGNRQDCDTLGEDGVAQTNVLTVVASESYEQFAEGLQREIADACADRPQKVSKEMFVGTACTAANGQTQAIDDDTADDIIEMLIMNGYLRHGQPTQKYYDERDSGQLDFGELNKMRDTICQRLDSLLNADSAKPANGREVVEGHFCEQRFRDEFLSMWRKINIRSSYTVHFSSQELIEKAIKQLDERLSVTEIRIVVKTGTLEKIYDKRQLKDGTAMKTKASTPKAVNEAVGNVRYDLIGQLVARTGLTRRTIAAIMKGVDAERTFSQFRRNPEEFIMKSARIINACKAASMVEGIEYNKLNGTYDKSVFTESALRGKLGENALRSKKSLYDIVVTQSKKETEFAAALENEEMVEVYTKLPHGFFINTPMGHYNPDWAIVFREDSGVKHIYFIAETKGEDVIEADLREIEKDKIACAARHFRSIGTSGVTYDVVSSWESLYNKVMK